MNQPPPTGPWINQAPLQSSGTLPPSPTTQDSVPSANNQHPQGPRGPPGGKAVSFRPPVGSLPPTGPNTAPAKQPMFRVPGQGHPNTGGAPPPVHRHQQQPPPVSVGNGVTQPSERQAPPAPTHPVPLQPQTRRESSVASDNVPAREPSPTSNSTPVDRDHQQQQQQSPPPSSGDVAHQRAGGGRVLSPKPQPGPQMSTEQLIAFHSENSRQKDQKMKLLRERFNMLLQHNDKLGDEFLRVRLVLDGYRSIVANELRPDTAHLKADLANLKSVVLYQTQSFDRDFTTLKDAIGELGQIATDKENINNNNVHGRQGVNSAKASDFYEADYDDPQFKKQSRNQHYARHHVEPPYYRGGRRVEDNNDQYSEDLPPTESSIPTTTGADSAAGPFDGPLEPMVPKRILDAVTIEKLLLEERVQRMEEEHQRHISQLKSLHKEREATLLSQLNMLSAVADHRDKEEAAVLVLNGSNNGPRSVPPAHQVINGRNSGGAQIIEPPPSGLTSHNTSQQSLQSAVQMPSSSSQQQQPRSAVTRLGGGAMPRYRSVSPNARRDEFSGGSGRATSTGRDSSRSVDPQAALWADRVLKDRGSHVNSQRAPSSGGQGESAGASYGQINAQKRLNEKRSRRDNLHGGAPRVSNLDHYSRSASAHRTSPARRQNITRDSHGKFGY